METSVIEEPNFKVEVFSDLEALSQRAALIFVSASRNSIAREKRFAVAISGGSTPRRVYTLLGSEPHCYQVDWQHVHFFWADERCVPKDDEASNHRAAFDRLLSKVPIPEENIHRIRGEESPERGAREYEKEIRQFFGTSVLPIFDLIILGMGEDGHTASLFPGSKSLDKKDRLAAPVYLEKPHIDRVTLTFPVLNNADQILFLVSGRPKAAVLSKILKEGHPMGPYPAGRIKPVRGSLTWLIDQEAAGQIER